MLELVRHLACDPESHDYHAHARRLLATYGADALNQALACQDELMAQGDESAAMIVLRLLTAIWDMEDEAEGGGTESGDKS